MMQRKKASVDCGNGGTNGVIQNEDGKIKSFYAPSYRATTDGKTLSMSGGMGVMKYDYIEWYGRKYVVGDTAMRLGSDDVETHRGDNRYGNEMQAMLIANALANLGVKDGEVDLTVFAPPGIYEQVKDFMKEQLMKEPVEIRLSSDKKPRCWKYSAVHVLPEGIGMAACLLLDEHGAVRNSEYMEGRVLLMDGGAQTFDTLEILNGNINPNQLKHATYKNHGIIRHIIEPILQHYQERNLNYLNIGHVDAAIRRGVVTGEYILDPDNVAINIEPAITELSNAYAEWISNEVIDGKFGSLNAYRRAYLFGGVANLCMERMSNMYPTKLIDTRKIPALKKIDPVDMNAIGGLRLAIARSAKK